jgi:hypothetical protein
MTMKSIERSGAALESVTPDDWIVCNCAECGCLLLGDAMRSRYAVAPSGYFFVAGRVNGRPHCRGCLRARKPPPGRATPEDGGGPWQQNVVRQLEGE